MKTHRPGSPKRLHFRHDHLARWTVKNAKIIDVDEGGVIIDRPQLEEISDFDTKEKMRLIARRHEELRLRGYPDEWIQRDLEKLIEGL